MGEILAWRSRDGVLCTRRPVPFSADGSRGLLRSVPVASPSVLHSKTRGCEIPGTRLRGLIRVFPHRTSEDGPVVLDYAGVPEWHLAPSSRRNWTRVPVVSGG